MKAKWGRGNPRGKFRFEKQEECGRCGFTYYESELNSQDGLKVCKTCLDDESTKKKTG